MCVCVCCMYVVPVVVHACMYACIYLSLPMAISIKGLYLYYVMFMLYVTYDVIMMIL